MANKQNCTTINGLADLQFLLIELEKTKPNAKAIKALTTKYGIPYKSNVSEQLSELLNHLNGLDISLERPPTKDI